MIARVEGESDREFVALEFMTWLWWCVETRDGSFDMPRGGKTLHLAIEDDLHLRGEDEPEIVLRGGLPTRSPEAAAALAAGKRLAAARIIISDGDREWTLKLDAAGYRMLQVRIPDTGDEQDDRDLAIFSAYEEIGDAIDTLFEQFLSERLSVDFATVTLPAMQRWVASKEKRRGTRRS